MGSMRCRTFSAKKGRCARAQKHYCNYASFTPKNPFHPGDFFAGLSQPKKLGLKGFSPHPLGTSGPPGLPFGGRSGHHTERSFGHRAKLCRLAARLQSDRLGLPLEQSLGPLMDPAPHEIPRRSPPAPPEMTRLRPPAGFKSQPPFFGRFF